MLSTLRLFKALPVDVKDVSATIDKELASETLKAGFIFAPEVTNEYTPKFLMDMVNQLYGRNSEELNQTFHKSFAKVQDAPIMQLLMEQVLHYFTTYGAETLGFYDQDSVYVPREHLDAPDLEEGLRIVVIRGLTKAELKAELLKLLAAGVALHENTVTDAIEVAEFVGLQQFEVETITNREVKVALFEHLNMVPANPVEFLRFIVYRATEKTLLIKNPAVIEALKARDNLDLIRYFRTYEEEHGLENLARIFNRYKPIFLALRTNAVLKRIVNRVRRLAVKHHRPMPEDLLNTLTGRLKNGNLPDPDELGKALQGANTFRKIRLAYALKFRTTGSDSIMYRIRNGKSFAKEFNFTETRMASKLYDVVMGEVIRDITPKVSGKKVFIPAGLKYGLPATEKQFTGNFPTGTYVQAGEDMIAGIHWFNQDGPRGGKGTHRIDLDLSVTNADGKIGWDGAYRNGEVLWSGDMTDAPLPHGASEVFHVGRNARGSWLLNVNFYNSYGGGTVPFKIVVGNEDRALIEESGGYGRRNYTVDPNKIIAMANSEIDGNSPHRVLGIIVADGENTKFYFAEAKMLSGRSIRNSTAAEHARKFLLNNYTNAIVLNDVLVAAGATLVDTPEEADIDLSWEVVDKTTILDLIS